MRRSWRVLPRRRATAGRLTSSRAGAIASLPATVRDSTPWLLALVLVALAVSGGPAAASKAGQVRAIDERSRQPRRPAARHVLAAPNPDTGGTAAQAQQLAPVRGRWRGPAGELLPFRTHEEVIEFLAEAEIVDTEPVGSGTTRPLRVTLERNGVRARAHFQAVDEEHERVRLSNGEHVMNLTDSYRNDCAAYEMARLLGIDRVPPLVKRRVRGDDGRLQLWIEGTITEGERRERGWNPPRRFEWMVRVQTMYLFDDVIGNVDRNQGNILLDAGFGMWLIDHTRAFQRRVEPRHLEQIRWVDRDVWERLRGLERERVEERLGPYISVHEIDELMRRIDLVVDHVESLIEVRGAEAVLVDAPTDGAPR